MSTKETKPKKPRSSTKKATTAQLEAKIAELEAKLTSLSAHVKPAETRPPPPKPAETRPPPPKPAETRPPPPKAEEVAPAYSSVSSESYTGNRYFATRQRLAYHPADKQFMEAKPVTFEETPSANVEASQSSSQRETAQTSSQSKPSSSWKSKGAKAAEEYEKTHHR